MYDVVPCAIWRFSYRFISLFMSLKSPSFFFICAVCLDFRLTACDPFGFIPFGLYREPHRVSGIRIIVNICL
ncbi:Uncharacterized protein HZ326_15451 [Fusarium oxysporum f. sp. albedinis]|nr:Uncharacterized protein HZ326_15451 [Fusarium oxysporum f. sp. albedinis]